MSSRAMNFANLIFRICTFVLFTGFFWTILKLPSNLEHEDNGFDSNNATTSIWDKLINFLRFYSDHHIQINMEVQENHGFRSCTTNHIYGNSTSAIIQWSEVLHLHLPTTLTNVIELLYSIQIKILLYPSFSITIDFPDL